MCEVFAMRDAIIREPEAIDERKPVPMAFSELSEAMLEPKMAPLVTNLVELKRNGLEKGACEQIPELDGWVLAQEEVLGAKIDTLERPEGLDWSVLDELFLKMVS